MTQKVGGFSVFDYVNTWTVDQADANQTPGPGFDYSLATKYEIQSHNSVTVSAELTEARKGAFIGIARHNLGSQGISIAVYSKTLVGDAWEERLAETAIADDNVKFIELDSSETDSFWRIDFIGDNINSYFYQISIGELYNFGRNQPPRVINEIVPSQESEIGASKLQWLGKKPLNKPVRYNIEFKHRDIAGVVGIGVLAAGGYELITKKPFFYAWDYDNNPAEAMYSWTEKPLKMPTYINTIHANIKLDVWGVR